MMSSVSPLHPIGKLIDSGSPVSFYGLGPSNAKETSPSVNCIGVNLSTSSPPVSTNSIVNIIACSTASASQTSSNVSNTNSGFKSNSDRLKGNIPYAWKREQINGQIVYISPSNCLLWSLQEISAYLLTEGTCKCGLECPIILNEVFNFDPQAPSISSTLINDNKSVKYNDHTKDICYDDNPTNIEYPPKTCNHRRRTLNNCSSYSNDSYSIITNDTHNQISARLANHTSDNSEITNHSLQRQQHHVNPQVIHQQPLAVNSIPVYRGTHQQSIINHGVTLYKSGGNFNNSEQKQSPYAITRDCSQTAENTPKNFQHPNVNSPLTTSSFINWLPINTSDESRLSSIVNENQSNVQTFANPSSSLPGFTDVISGMGLTQTLMDPNSQGAGQLVQLFNPVQYASVPPNTVTLLQPPQNLNRNGATILIPRLMQSDQHSVVLNSTENVRSLERRNILPATSFSSIPLQSPYLFHSQPSASYPTSSSSSSSTSSPTQSFAATSSNENDNNRFKTKARSIRHRKFKMNRNQHLSMSVSPYFCHDQETNTSIEKFTEKNSDESSRLKSDIDDEFNLEEQMDSQDCIYSTNQLTPNSDDDKSNFDYERIDGGSQCTSEDIMRELSTHKNSIGVQSDELIDDPVSPTRIDDSSCSNSSFAPNFSMSKDTEYDSSPSNLAEDYEENADSILETNSRSNEKNVEEHFLSDYKNDETQGDFNNNSHNDESDKISEYESNSSLNIDAYKIEKNSDENNITNYIDDKVSNDYQNDSENYQNKSSISIKKVNIDQSVSKNNGLLNMGTTEGLYERLSKTIDEESTKNKKLERLRKELLCYENNFDQTTAQSPPLSPQPRTFETGDLVWGQMRGNPSWPGKLINKEDAPSLNGQTEEGKVWVKWFGDNLVTQVELIKLKTLSEGLEAHHTARKKHRKGKKTDSCLDQAIQEAMMELDKQQSSSAASPTSKSHPPTTSSSLPS